MAHRNASRLACAALALVLAGCMSPTDAPASASTPPVDYTPDAGPPSPVQVKSKGNALPPPWVVTSAWQMAADGGGQDAAAHLNERAAINAALTVSNNPCPLPFQSYCDGFNAIQGSDGGVVVVDTFTYLGPPSGLPCVLPSSGSIASISGVWEDKYDSTAKTNIFVLALTDCSDVGGAPPYTGTTSAGSSTDIAALLAAFAPGSAVTVKGVVVAASPVSSAGGFSFTIEDPAGGPKSGISVVRAASSGSTALAPPSIGDFVQVTGTTDLLGLKQVISL